MIRLLNNCRRFLKFEFGTLKERLVKRNNNGTRSIGMTWFCSLLQKVKNEKILYSHWKSLLLESFIPFRPRMRR
ncbi:hypothetical protein L6164_014687 [Bauhinia variegata]|uniref:Uncharacterized protein n=1 Tax=Bauhinia variegata TaxID=167791 RepID=A0ACB9NHY7_BAUVA|nr:hypothetical protein L6164_014687 [Bauhinia variegata]